MDFKEFTDLTVMLVRNLLVLLKISERGRERCDRAIFPDVKFMFVFGSATRNGLR